MMVSFDRQQVERNRAASNLGYQHGRNAGSWVIDGNTTQETARAILSGYEDGDPLVMDMQPSPLSGEWADSMTIGALMDALGVAYDEHGAETISDYERDALCDCYEDGFGLGFWDEVVRSARAILED